VLVYLAKPQALRDDGLPIRQGEAEAQPVINAGTLYK
jgi:hypothetical protein